MSKGCGCSMTITGGVPLKPNAKVGTFTQCPLHRAAPKLLEVLEEIAPEWHISEQELLKDGHIGLFADCPDKDCTAARAAIAEARSTPPGWTAEDWKGYLATEARGEG